MSLSALGGTGPGKVVGHVCGTCREAQRRTNRSWGARTLVYSLVLHLVPEAANSIAVDEVRVDISAYGAEVARAARRRGVQPIATATPWGFLSDKADLVTDLRALLARG